MHRRRKCMDHEHRAVLLPVLVLYGLAIGVRATCSLPGGWSDYSREMHAAQPALPGTKKNTRERQRKRKAEQKKCCVLDWSCRAPYAQKGGWGPTEHAAFACARQVRTSLVEGGLCPRASFRGNRPCTSSSRQML